MEQTLPVDETNDMCYYREDLDPYSEERQLNDACTVWFEQYWLRGNYCVTPPYVSMRHWKARQQAEAFVDRYVESAESDDTFECECEYDYDVEAEPNIADDIFGDEEYQSDADVVDANATAEQLIPAQS